MTTNDDLNYLVNAEFSRLRGMRKKCNVTVHFAMDDLPCDMMTCRQMLYVFLNNNWSRMQCDVVKNIRSRRPTVAFYQIFSSLVHYHRFMCLCLQQNLIVEGYTCGMMLERVTVRPEKGKLMQFARLLKSFLIDHPYHAVDGMDMSLLKRFISTGRAIICNNIQSLTSDMYRL